VHAGHIDRDAPNFAALILPNVAALSDAQCAALRRFLQRGGALLATGVTSLYNEWGERRPDFALADLFGAHAKGSNLGSVKWAAGSFHTYLRLAPELRASVLRGFDDTDILPFGGMLEALPTDSGAVVPLTFIPPFPVYPPETAWMREPKTDIPGLVLKGRVAYMPADIDRRFGRDNLPDHGNLLANLVRWAAGDNIPLKLEGRGLIDCHLYRQPGRLILHLVNLTSAGTWRAPIDELIPAGPLRVKIKLPEDVRGHRSQLLVSGAKTRCAVEQGWAAFELKSVLDHEVVVVT
jgi:hypothetical protein